MALLANIAIITGFLVFVSYSKHLHIFLAPINVATSRRPRALGALASTPDMSMEDVGEDDEVVFGAGRIEDFSWKQLLDMATCTECGRCQSQCPAWNTGKPLSPKLLIMDLRDNLFASADRVMAKNRAAGVEVENLVPIGHRPRRPVVLHHLRGVRRAVPGRHRAHRHHHRHAPLRGADGVQVPDRGRPHAPQHREPGRPVGARLAPSGPTGSTRSTSRCPVITGTIPDDIEYLYWVGCAGALDERARKGAQATARMLHRAGVTFGILGPKERCTGDPARRLGNEYLYQEQARMNIETLDGAGVKKVIATCPHCFNSLANEYPSLGGNFEVIHHSQLLDHLVTGGQADPRRRVRGHGHLPRPLLPGPPQPGLRRAPLGHRRHPRGHPGRDEAVPREGVLLRCRRGPDVARGEHRQAGQHGADRGGHRDRAPTWCRPPAPTA